MVDFNPNASGLQAQIQAQLEANRSRGRVAAPAVDAIQRQEASLEERLRARGDENAPNRRAPAARASSANLLSSQQELEAAGTRINDLAGQLREAPAGRTSVRQTELRNQPLGQIVDIRV